MNASSPHATSPLFVENAVNASFSSHASPTSVALWQMRHAAPSASIWRHACSFATHRSPCSFVKSPHLSAWFFSKRRTFVSVTVVHAGLSSVASSSQSSVSVVSTHRRAPTAHASHAV